MFQGTFSPGNKSSREVLRTLVPGSESSQWELYTGERKVPEPSVLHLETLKQIYKNRMVLKEGIPLTVVIKK